MFGSQSKIIKRARLQFKLEFEPLLRIIIHSVKVQDIDWPY